VGAKQWMSTAMTVVMLGTGLLTGTTVQPTVAAAAETMPSSVFTEATVKYLTGGTAQFDWTFDGVADHYIVSFKDATMGGTETFYTNQSSFYFWNLFQYRPKEFMVQAVDAAGHVIAETKATTDPWAGTQFFYSCDRWEPNLVNIGLWADVGSEWQPQWALYKNGEYLFTTTMSVDVRVSETEQTHFKAVAIGPMDRELKTLEWTFDPSIPLPIVYPRDLTSTTNSISLSHPYVLLEEFDHIGIKRDGHWLTQQATFPYVDSGLAPDTQYEYEYVVFDAAGQVLGSNKATARTQQLPFAIHSSATVLSPYAVQLHFDANKPYYETVIYRNGTLLKPIAFTGYVDHTVQPGQTYTYKVELYDRYVPGVWWSKPIGAKQVTVTVPTYQLQATAEATSHTDIALHWSANYAATQYVVKRDGVAIGTTAAQTFTETGLAPSTSYTYTIEAYSGMKLLGTQTATATTKEAPFALTVTALENTKHTIDLQFIANKAVATYVLTRDGDVVYTGTDARYLDEKLKSETTYHYALTAYDAAGMVLGTSEQHLNTALTPGHAKHQ